MIKNLKQLGIIKKIKLVQNRNADIIKGLEVFAKAITSMIKEKQFFINQLFQPIIHMEWFSLMSAVSTQYLDIHCASNEIMKLLRKSP